MHILLTCCIFLGFLRYPWTLSSWYVIINVLNQHWSWRPSKLQKGPWSEHHVERIPFTPLLLERVYTRWFFNHYLCNWFILIKLAIIWYWVTSRMTLKTRSEWNTQPYIILSTNEQTAHLSCKQLVMAYIVIK
jgi:hypothetical protein